MGEVGRLALLFSFPIIVYGIVSHLIAIRTKNPRWLRSAKASAYILVFLTTLSSGSLIYLLVTGNFNYEYVSLYSSTDMSLFYKITAFWGGNAGSLLLWFWILSIYTALVTFSKHKDSSQYIPWVSTTLLIINAFFAFILNSIEPPFALNDEQWSEGNGLNPLLQNPGMAVHPITLYLGYIGFAIPFAYGMAALILKKADAVWIKVTRKWVLVSWLFLSMGILFGSQWAYVELGWGGFWAWDPVENASLLPWLTATALLHSTMVQERKGMLKRWNIILVTITFILTIFGTFLTRSGLLWSVHAFSNGPIGAYFLTFIGLLLVASIWMITSSWSVLKSDAQFESYLSKESSFLVNNLLLVASAFTVFWGTIYPVISEAVTGSKVMVGAPYFNRVNIPIFIAVIILMGIGPIVAWKRSSFKAVAKNLSYPFALTVILGAALWIAGVSSLMTLLSLMSTSFVAMIIFLEFAKAVQARIKVTGESALRSLFMLFVKNRRRYGGYVAHFGVILIAIGYTGASAYSVDTQRALSEGESVELGKYTLTSRGLAEISEEGRQIVYGELLVEKAGDEIGVVRPNKVFYTNGNQPTTEVSVVSSVQEDLFVILNGWTEEDRRLLVQVKIFPLISWTWTGGYILIVGTLISLWPEKLSRRRTIMKTESVLYG